MNSFNKIFFEGDLQLYKANSDYNKDSARFNAQKTYIDWVLNNPKLNNENIIYFSLGDFFETSTPTPEEYQLAIHYLSNAAWPKKYILAGNHDYSRYKNSHSIQPFSKLPNITLILKPQELEIERIKILALPYYYDHIYYDLPAMKEYYESLEGNYDLIVTHIQDETQTMFGNNQSIDISKLKGQRIQGHLHAVKGNTSGYVNSPIPCTKGEVLDKRYSYLYDIETKSIEKIEIPLFLNYEEIHYPDPIPESKIHKYYTLYTIKESVDKETTLNFYRKQMPKIYIKEIRRKKLQELQEENKAQDKKSILDFFKDYAIENKLSQEVQKIILEKIPML